MCQSVTNDLYNHSVQLNRWFLKPIGAWPRSSDTTKSERTMSNVLIFICYFLIAFTIVPCALNIFFEEKHRELKLQAIGPLSHWSIGGMNYCFLLLRNADILRCVQHMETDWKITKRSQDRDIMASNARMGRFMAGICAICMHSGVYIYSIVAGMKTVEILVGNESVSMLQLPCPVYGKFIDVRFSPAKEIVLVMQLLSGFIVNSTTIGACSLAAVFAMHACGQFDILTLRLNKLVENEGTKKNVLANQRMADIVDHHLRVLRFITYIEKVMNQICLVELVGCTFNLCIIGYNAITRENTLRFFQWWNKIDSSVIVSYAIVYVSMSFNIFIFCYIGEILTQQCKKVGETAYMTDWYHLPHKTALGLILIILRSSAVIKITAGKLFQLSIATFSDVIKTSFVYINMLRTVTAT